MQESIFCLVSKIYPLDPCVRHKWAVIQNRKNEDNADMLPECQEPWNTKAALTAIGDDPELEQWMNQWESAGSLLKTGSPHFRFNSFVNVIKIVCQKQGSEPMELHLLPLQWTVKQTCMTNTIEEGMSSWFRAVTKRTLRNRSVAIQYETNFRLRQHPLYYHVHIFCAYEFALVCGHVSEVFFFN